MAKLKIHTGKSGQPATKTDGVNLRLMSEAPPPPIYFTDEAAAVWNRTADILIDREQLSEADLPTLEIYAHSVGMFRHANQMLALTGFEVQTARGLQPSHMIAIRKGAEVQMQSSARALGLTPKARADMKLASSAPAEHIDKTGGF